MFESKKYIWTALKRTYKYHIHACMLTILLCSFGVWGSFLVLYCMTYIYIYAWCFHYDVFCESSNLLSKWYCLKLCLNLLFIFFGYKLGQPVVQNVSLLTKLQQLLSNWYCQNFCALGPFLLLSDGTAGISRHSFAHEHSELLSVAVFIILLYTVSS